MIVLQQQMLPMDVEAVKKIPISHVLQPDFWAWHYERSGSFSVRSAYKLVVETKKRREAWLNCEAEASNTEQEEKSWKKLWSVQVPPKIRMFACWLARSSLPTGEVRVRRQMSTSVTRIICGAAEDSWRHALLDCNMAKSVWLLREDDVVIPLIGDETPNAKLWMFNLTKTLKEDQFVEVLVTLWALWWARRKAIHEQEFQSPLSTHLFISRYLDEVPGSQRGQSRSNRSATIRVPQAWKPPLMGHAKLNADAAVAKRGKKYKQRSRGSCVQG